MVKQGDKSDPAGASAEPRAALRSNADIRRAALAKAADVSQKEPERCESALSVHPFFGYTWNKTMPFANNYGFRAPHNFTITSKGHALEGIDRSRHLVIGVFGGSFAWFVADQHRAIEDMLRPHVAPLEPLVVNFAFGGHGQPQPFFIFSSFIELVDIAVFIDGINELWNFCENNKLGCPPEYAKGVHYQYLLARQELSPHTFELTSRMLAWQRSARIITGLSLLPGVQSLNLTHTLWARMTRWIEQKVVRIESRLHEAYAGGPSFSPLEDSEIVKLAAARWEHWHTLISMTARERQVLDLHFLQPTLFADGGRALLPAEEGIVNGVGAVGTSISAGYRLLQGAVSTLAARGTRMFPLQELFSGIAGPVWFDAWHCYPEYSATVATQVAARVLDELLTLSLPEAAQPAAEPSHF